MSREIYKRIRELLKLKYPNVDIRIQDSNGINKTIMMYPLNNKQFFNFEVKLGNLLEFLEKEHYPAADTDTFLKEIDIPKWMIEHFKDKAKVLNKSTDK